MEIKATRVNSANATIEAVLLKATVDTRVEKIAKQAAKTMNVDGFRKGKVPLAVIKRRFGEKLIQDAEGELLREVVDGGAQELKVAKETIIGEPQVTKFDKKDDKTEVEVKIGLKPEFDLGEYDSIIPEVSSIEIEDGEVEDRIKELAKNSAPMNKVEEDRAVAEGDFALIDFDGYVDGEPLENGKAEGYSLEIGSKSFIPGFEEQVVGMKSGEEKEIEVTFPEDYGKADIAGKLVKFQVKVNEISVRGEVEINDELAKTIMQGQEDASLEVLTEKVKEQITNEKKGKLYNEELKPALIDKLIENYNFDLPEFVVEQEIDLAFRNKLQSMKEEEINELKNNADGAKEIRDNLREDAQRSVKITFIVDALSKKEEVAVDDNEVMQTIYFEAMQFGQDPKAMVEMYEKQGLMPAVKMAMVEDKLLSKLLDRKLKA